MNGPAYGFLRQLASTGYLFVWESLLSTVGHEYGMIEDMHVAIKARSRVCVCVCECVCVCVCVYVCVLRA